MIHIHNYKQSANSEVHSDNDEIFIPVSTNIPKEISPNFSKFLQCYQRAQLQHILLADMANKQQQVDSLKQGMEKSASENNEFN